MGQSRSCYSASRSITLFKLFSQLCLLMIDSSIQKVHGEIVKGVNGLDKFVLREPRGSSAEIYLYGSHVTSWKNECGEELLFLGSKAIFKPPKAIRGGIPICFPQFSHFGPLDSHGFARNRIWSVDPTPPPFPTSSASSVFVDLILKPSADDLKIWPNSFEFRIRIALGPGGALMMTSRVKNTNTDGKPFSFTFAYHTYYSVLNISEVQVEGLKTLAYLDNTQNGRRSTEQADVIIVQSEVDRVYLNTPANIPLQDNGKKRTYMIHKDGLPDTVVWNPWAKTIEGLGVDDYKHMIAVEAAAVDKPITLKPGEEWRGSLEISTVPPNSCSGQPAAIPRKVLGS